MDVKIAPQMSLLDKLKILADAAKYAAVPVVLLGRMTVQVWEIRWRQDYATALVQMEDVFLY